MSANQRERRAAETVKERQQRLEHMSANQRDRRAAETVEERQQRLEHMSANQRERLAAETVEEREARLQRTSANQCERRAAESIEEREERWQRASERDTRTTREEPFKQRSVQLKMRRFHEHFASLSSPTCSTCSESFPGIQLCSSTTMCVRCYRDKRIPKLYSSTNNMDPGPLPPQLQVSACVCINY